MGVMLSTESLALTGSTIHYESGRNRHAGLYQPITVNAPPLDPETATVIECLSYQSLESRIRAKDVEFT